MHRQAVLKQARPLVDGMFIWTASHDQRQCSLSTVSIAVAIVAVGRQSKRDAGPVSHGVRPHKLERVKTAFSLAEYVSDEHVNLPVPRSILAAVTLVPVRVTIASRSQPTTWSTDTREHFLAVGL